MIFESLVNFLFLANAFLVLYKQIKNQPQYGALRLAFGGLLLAWLFADLRAFFRADNYYTFMELRRNFEPAELQRAVKTQLKRFHPDKNPSAANEYLTAQELGQIFGEPKHKSLVTIYNVYGADLRTLAFDKFAGKSIEVYRLDKQNRIWIDYYILLFLQLFMLKEIKRTSYRLKLGFLLVVAACFGLEAVVYDIYGLGQHQRAFFQVVNSIPALDYLTVAQVLALAKRLALWAWIVALFGYITFRRRSSRLT